MSGSIEHKAEAVRRVMASLPILARAPLGSWFEGRKDTGTVGLVQTIVTTTMRYDIWAESLACERSILGECACRTYLVRILDLGACA